MNLKRIIYPTVKLFLLILLFFVSFFVFVTKDALAIDYSCSLRIGYCKFGTVEFKASNLSYESGSYFWNCGKNKCPLGHAVVSPESSPVVIVEKTQDEIAALVKIAKEDKGSKTLSVSESYKYSPSNPSSRSELTSVVKRIERCPCPKCDDPCESGFKPVYKVDGKNDGEWRCIDVCGNVSEVCPAISIKNKQVVNDFSNMFIGKVGVGFYSALRLF